MSLSRALITVPKKVPGTCEWFQSHHKFRNWLASRNRGLFLLSASPGCGKSVLSRFLVEKILPAGMPVKTTLCYFFFDIPDQKNIPAALCALIHQVLTWRPELTDLVQKDIIGNGPALTLKERVLWRVFGKLVSAHVDSDVVCVLDALDECQKDGRPSLVGQLQTLLAQTVYDGYDKVRDSRECSRCRPRSCHEAPPAHDCRSSDPVTSHGNPASQCPGLCRRGGIE